MILEQKSSKSPKSAETNEEYVVEKSYLYSVLRPKLKFWRPCRHQLSSFDTDKLPQDNGDINKVNLLNSINVNKIQPEYGPKMQSQRDLKLGNFHGEFPPQPTLVGSYPESTGYVYGISSQNDYNLKSGKKQRNLEKERAKEFFLKT